MILAHHGAAEAIALFVPALAIVGVIAGAIVLDRRRGAEEEDAGPAGEDGPAGETDETGEADETVEENSESR